MNAVATPLRRSVPLAGSLRATTGLLVAAAATPLLVHLLPSWDALPLGAHLLPMFWMAAVAVYLSRFHTALLAALAGPAAAYLVTGAPNVARLFAMTAELLGFVTLAALLARKWPRAWVIAPASYVAAKFMVAVFTGAAMSTFLPGLVNALAGLAILTAINIALVRLARREG